MFDRNLTLRAMEEKKIIVILRNYTNDQLLHIVDALAKGGIGLVEITFDQKGTISNKSIASQIDMLSRTYHHCMHIGAGTVMTTEQVELAHSAGAEYIISPDCYEPVIHRTQELGMLSIPGCYTPTEAANAARWGADFVKIFPNSEVRISYLKNIMVPLSHIRFLAVGGVDEISLPKYLEIGVSGFGIATAIVDRTSVEQKNWEKITENARKYMKLIQAMKNIG